MQHTYSKLTRKIGYDCLLAVSLFLTAFPLAISADDRQIEAIDAPRGAPALSWAKLWA
jgi:hypothetical protein